MDVAGNARNRAHRQDFKASPNASPEAGGRSVDVETQKRRLTRKQKELNSRNFVKPSDGLEPSTPSLPSAGGNGFRFLGGFRADLICH